MAFFYIELKEGHIFQLFPDGKTPSIPEDKNLALIEITDMSADQITKLIESGFGKFTLDALNDKAQSDVKERRFFSTDSKSVEPSLAVDVDPKTIIGRKFKLNKEIPGKPIGAIFAVDPNDPVPRVRCITDPLHWYDLVIFDAASSLTPEKPLAAQGFDVVEF